MFFTPGTTQLSLKLCVTSLVDSGEEEKQRYDMEHTTVFREKEKEAMMKNEKRPPRASERGRNVRETRKSASLCSSGDLNARSRSLSVSLSHFRVPQKKKCSALTSR